MIRNTIGIEASWRWLQEQEGRVEKEVGDPLKQEPWSPLKGWTMFIIKQILVISLSFTNIRLGILSFYLDQVTAKMFSWFAQSPHSPLRRGDWAAWGQWFKEHGGFSMPYHERWRQIQWLKLSHKTRMQTKDLTCHLRCPLSLSILSKRGRPLRCFGRDHWSETLLYVHCFPANLTWNHSHSTLTFHSCIYVDVCTNMYTFIHVCTWRRWGLTPVIRCIKCFYHSALFFFFK